MGKRTLVLFVMKTPAFAAACQEAEAILKRRGFPYRVVDLTGKRWPHKVPALGITPENLVVADGLPKIRRHLSLISWVC